MRLKKGGVQKGIAVQHEGDWILHYCKEKLFCCVDTQFKLPKKAQLKEKSKVLFLFKNSNNNKKNLRLLMAVTFLFYSKILLRCLRDGKGSVFLNGALRCGVKYFLKI